MTTFALDSSCMIAAVCSWHKFHSAVLNEVEVRLASGEKLAIACHALLETYSVLTRLPSPHRLAPETAWTLVQTNFVEQSELVAIDVPAYVSLIAGLAQSGVSGGRVYDCLITRCAEESQADSLVTLNEKHFRPAPNGIVIVDPSAGHS